jgi:hypothetical protein
MPHTNFLGRMLCHNSSVMYVLAQINNSLGLLQAKPRSDLKSTESSLITIDTATKKHLHSIEALELNCVKRRKIKRPADASWTVGMRHYNQLLFPELRNLNCERSNKAIILPGLTL